MVELLENDKFESGNTKIGLLLNRYKVLLFWLVFIMILLLIFELSIRGWDYYRGRGSERYLIPYARYLGYKSHPFLSYVLRPNFVPDHRKYRINSAGFKSDHEISKEKAKNTIRIFCLGGSTTYDGEHNDPETYPGVLGSLLKKKYPDKNFEVINAGVPSWTTLENMINLQVRLLDYAPDIVIYYGGVNNARANLSASSSYKSDQTHFRKSFPSDDWFDNQHYWLLSFFEKSRLFLFLRYKLTSYKDKMYIHHYIFKLPVNKISISNSISEKGLKAFSNEIRNMAAISKEHGVAFVLSTFTWNKDFPKDVGGNRLFVPLLKQQNKIIRELSAMKDIPLADVERLFPNEKDLFVDDVHLTEKGNEYLAKIIFNTILETDIIK